MSEAAKIRKGEELDTEKLSEYLVNTVSKEFSDFSLKQFPAGSSNLTYLLRTNSGEYVLRRPPFGNRVKTAHDMKREFDVLSALQGQFKPAPKPIHYCPDNGVIGAEFYLMNKANGIVVRNDWPFPASDANIALESFVSTLVELHAVDWRSAGLTDFGRPEGYVKRQIEGWSARYFKARTDDWPRLERAIEWLNRDIPADGEAVLVHNDYKFDNVMFDPEDVSNVTAVLDWEMATIGCPLMDLGTTLGYWMSREVGEELLSMPFNPRYLMENFSRDNLIGKYAEISKRDVDNINYYYVFGTVKIAVIAQQIYYRYAKGLTADKRFSVFNRFVGALGEIASKAI